MRRSRDDWIEAATDMGVRLGFDSIAIEPLAAEIGATKGSFYWHFSDRAELLISVAERWADLATHDVIHEVESGSPSSSLERLIDIVLGHRDTELLNWRMLNATGHPQIGPIVARVHDVRIDYVRKLLRDRGLSPARASARARVLYAAYLGNLALLHVPGLDRPARRTGLRREFQALIDAP